MILLKNSRTDFSQGDCQDRPRDHSNGVLRWRSETGFNSKDNKEEWEFVVKELGGDSCWRWARVIVRPWWAILSHWVEDEDFCLNQLNLILAKVERCRDKYESWKVEALLKKSSEELQVWSWKEFCHLWDQTSFYFLQWKQFLLFN